MAHHSSYPDPNVRSLLADMFAAKNPPLGPTGEFPLGKLTPQDEGEIRVGITHMDGKVVIDFGKAVVWLGFTPEQADGIADTLREHAQAIRRSAASHPEARDGIS